jgi:hypothetical protein
MKCIYNAARCIALPSIQRNYPQAFQRLVHEPSIQQEQTPDTSAQTSAIIKPQQVPVKLPHKTYEYQGTSILLHAKLRLKLKFNLVVRNVQAVICGY